MIRAITRSAVLASAVMLVACSGGKSSTVIEPPAPASIFLSTSTGTLAVAQGASGTATVTVGRFNFTGDVALTAEGLPTGVTAAFTPATLGVGETASSVALTVAGTVTAGTSTVTIRARATGVADRTTTIALTVTPAPGGTVSLALTPATASITAGQTSVTTIAITRGGGFAAGVDLTISGAPSGMTTTISTANPVTTNSVTLTVSTPASLTPGPYSLIVRGNSAGIAEATTTFTLTVDPPPSTSVAWRYCNVSRYPIWFAYLDGTTGTWQRVTETSPGLYNFAVGQPQVGVASVRTEGANTITEIRYLSLAEVTAAAAAECASNPVTGTKTLTGSVTGFANGTETATVSMGNALSSVASQGTPAFTISRVPSGALDVVAVRADIATSNALRFVLTRGRNIADGGSLGTLDLSTGGSFAPANGTVTVTAPNDGAIAGSNRFTTATGSSAIFNTAPLSSGVSATYQGIPDGLMVPSDLQQVQATQQVGTSLSRFITRYTRGPSAVTMTMPSDPAAPSIASAGSTPYARATVSGTVLSAYNSNISHSFDQATRSRRWDITISAGVREAGAYSATMPDFSSVAGWQTTWGLSAGSVEVTSNFSGQSNANPDGTPTTGTVQFTIGRKTTFTLP